MRPIAGGTEEPYRVDEEMDRAFARRSGELTEFLRPHFLSGMRLIDCGCGPGSITVDLAQMVHPGAAVGIDVREDALTYGRKLALERGVANVTFEPANVYRLPYPDGSFDAAFACALIQHLATPVEALREIRRVLNSGSVLGIIDGSSPIVFRYPTNEVLDAWDKLRVQERERRTGRPSPALELRALLREAGFKDTRADGVLRALEGPPAGRADATRSVAAADLIQLRGLRGKLAVEHGLATQEGLDQMEKALIAWGESPDGFFARPVFMGLGWA